MTTTHAARRIAIAAAVSFTGTSALLAQARPAEAQKRPAEHREATERAEPADHERTLRAAQVPQVVRDAFHRAYPSSVPRGYSSEQENGRTVYEIESREGAMTRDALITTDGTITEVEEGVPVAQLPAAVKTALDAQARGGRVTRSERVINMAARDTTYEFAVRGHRGEIKLTKSGALVPVQP